MEILLLTFLGLLGVAALIGVVFFIFFSALYATMKIGSFGLTKFSEIEPYVYRRIDVISTVTTISIFSLLHFIFEIDPIIAVGIGFLIAIPMIIYWYFWKPEFLNKPVNFLQ